MKEKRVGIVKIKFSFRVLERKRIYVNPQISIRIIHGSVNAENYDAHVFWHPFQNKLSRPLFFHRICLQSNPIFKIKRLYQLRAIPNADIRSHLKIHFLTHPCVQSQLHFGSQSTRPTIYQLKKVKTIICIHLLKDKLLF